MKLTESLIKELIEETLDEQEIAEDKNVIIEAGKCTGSTKKTSSTSKGKKWMKCARQPDGSYKRIHWGQKGVRVTGNFKARHNCGSAKSGSPNAMSCKDWAEE